jgi:hemerythrin-like metal-binding protein
MTLLNWKDEYSVGIEAIDYEHKELIDRINRLHQEFDAADAGKAVSAFFGDLLAGISAHFALEEKFMLDQAYDRLGPHKEDHERLLDELREMMDAFEWSEEIDTLELWRCLDPWFTQHFRKYDAELHDAIGTIPADERHGSIRTRD